MKASTKLAKNFAKAVKFTRSNKKTPTSLGKQKFLKNLDQQLAELAQALPYEIKTSRECSQELNLPAGLKIADGVVSLGQEKISYAEIRNLPSIQQLILMSERANTSIRIDFYSGVNLKDIVDAYDPKDRNGYGFAFDSLVISLSTRAPFDSRKYPKTLSVVKQANGCSLKI